MLLIDRGPRSTGGTPASCNYLYQERISRQCFKWNSLDQKLIQALSVIKIKMTTQGNKTSTRKATLNFKSFRPQFQSESQITAAHKLL